MQNSPTELLIPVQNYDLAATLSSGQAFRWRLHGEAWEGVIRGHWLRLQQTRQGIRAQTAVPIVDWSWLTDYLQTEVDVDGVIASFPQDEPMRLSVANCSGLRLLRQEPWECLASFILSSTKQIVQIQQIVELLCQRFGERVPAPNGHPPAFTFPTADRLSSVNEADLRACKMGFRAPNLLKSARMITAGEVDLERIRTMDLAAGRAELERLPGVGPKIANCVLLFAYGFPAAFPVDVWVLKALRKLYFPKRRPTAARILRFTATYFGPHAGYAQQYLFHYMRTMALGRDFSLEPATQKKK
jgi:N-glycosylase/DNA lyase